ncbi:MAG: hypothetical protein B7Z40_06520 [Bosea sp. 12-68-7]|nr:MAG: hypothetical protein B7Z40_06520 [Bosea sp. 12-68-7]
MLSQVTWNGTRAAVQSQLKAQALFRCETKVQEVVSGIEPLSDQSDVPFEDDSAWVWSLTVLPTDIPSLILVEVTVAKNGSSALGSASLKLRRWMRDPEALIQAMEEQAALQGDQSSVTTDSSSSSGSSP